MTTWCGERELVEARTKEGLLANATRSSLFELAEIQSLEFHREGPGLRSTDAVRHVRDVFDRGVIALEMTLSKRANIITTEKLNC